MQGRSGFLQSEPLAASSSSYLLSNHELWLLNCGRLRKMDNHLPLAGCRHCHLDLPQDRGERVPAMHRDYQRSRGARAELHKVQGQRYELVRYGQQASRGTHDVFQGVQQQKPFLCFAGLEECSTLTLILTTVGFLLSFFLVIFICICMACISAPGTSSGIQDVRFYCCLLELLNKIT